MKAMMLVFAFLCLMLPPAHAEVARSDSGQEALQSYEQVTSWRGNLCFDKLGTRIDLAEISKRCPARRDYTDIVKTYGSIEDIQTAGGFLLNGDPLKTCFDFCKNAGLAHGCFSNCLMADKLRHAN